jgi:hypothetical protein
VNSLGRSTPPHLSCGRSEPGWLAHGGSGGRRSSRLAVGLPTEGKPRALPSIPHTVLIAASGRAEKSCPRSAMTQCRFPPPCSVEELDACACVRLKNRRPLSDDSGKLGGDDENAGYCRNRGWTPVLNDGWGFRALCPRWLWLLRSRTTCGGAVLSMRTLHLQFGMLSRRL